jgi:organic hydroperoxide reductase OsmC/OhrA
MGQTYSGLGVLSLWVACWPADGTVRRMSHHLATVRWALGPGEFATGRYSREHTWTFDGGVTVPASPSPSVVPAPWSNAANVDPEEAFVAAIASCHLLTFLWLASKQGLVVERYEDAAVGTLSRNERNVNWVSAVVLKPRVSWRVAPTADVLAQLHHDAHEQCFIANSVRTAITVEAP